MQQGNLQNNNIVPNNNNNANPNSNPNNTNTNNNPNNNTNTNNTNTNNNEYNVNNLIVRQFQIQQIKRRERIISALDQLLSPFHTKQQPQPTFKYPLYIILRIMRNTGQFQPILLRQIALHFQRVYASTPTTQPIKVTKQQLLQQLCNPDIKVYQKQNHKQVYNILKGDKQVVRTQNIIQHSTNPQHKRLFKIGSLKSSISMEDIEQQLGSQGQSFVGQISPQQSTNNKQSIL